MLLAGLTLAALMVWQRGDWPTSLVLVWAFAGIGVKQSAAPLVSVSAWIAAALLVLLAAFALLTRRPVEGALTQRSG